MLSRLTVALTLATLALLPWSWFPPFPWLHVHAQWSDAVFAAAAFCWLVERRVSPLPFRFRPWHGWLAAYLVWAALSWWFVAPDRRAGAWKLLGTAELVVLAVVTADLASRPRVLGWMARVVAWNALAIAAAAGIGLALFYGGVRTPLIGPYGDLPSSPWYARMEAGTTNPNLLASYCIFAAALLAHEEADLPPALRRAAVIATTATVLLTFSRAIVGFGVAAALRAARKPRERLAAGALAMSAVALILALTVWDVRFDLGQGHAAATVGDVPGPRREAFVTAWRTLARRPLWGSGLGASPGFHEGRPYDAHCTPLNVAATLGLPALLALIGLFVSLWREREPPTDRATWSGLAGMGLDALASDVEEFRHLWVLIGLAGRPSDPDVRKDARG